MKILIVSDEGLIPSSYVRLINAFEYGKFNYRFSSIHEVRVENIDDFDVVIFQRCFSVKSLLFLRETIHRGKKIVYELDDNFLSLPKESGTIIHPKMIRKFLGNVHAVTCSTEALRSLFLKYNKNVGMIPNRIAVSTCKRKKRQDSFRILISNTDYFKLTKSKNEFFSAIERIVSEYPFVIIVVVGSVPVFFEELKKKKPSNVEIVPGFIGNYNDYLSLLLRLDVDAALVPLEESYSHSFKSNIKYLDFAAFGIPGVFSDVSVYNRTIVNGETGVLVDNTENGWYEGIRKIITDNEFTYRIVLRSFEDVSKNYNIKDSISDWKNLFAVLAEKKKMKMDFGCRFECFIRSIKISLLKRFFSFFENDLFSDKAGRVYIIKEGKKRHIPSPEIFEKNNFKWKDIKKSRFLISIVPEGKFFE
jgi:glycosyltransferase involved in cell wall biosynthesis